MIVRLTKALTGALIALTVTGCVTTFKPASQSFTPPAQAANPPVPIAAGNQYLQVIARTRFIDGDMADACRTMDYGLTKTTESLAVSLKLTNATLNAGKDIVMPVALLKNQPAANGSPRSCLSSPPLIFLIPITVYRADEIEAVVEVRSSTDTKYQVDKVAGSLKAVADLFMSSTAPVVGHLASFAASAGLKEVQDYLANAQSTDVNSYATVRVTRANMAGYLPSTYRLMINKIEIPTMGENRTSPFMEVALQFRLLPSIFEPIDDTSIREVTDWSTRQPAYFLDRKISAVPAGKTEVKTDAIRDFIAASDLVALAQAQAGKSADKLQATCTNIRGTLNGLVLTDSDQAAVMASLLSSYAAGFDETAVRYAGCFVDYDLAAALNLRFFPRAAVGVPTPNACLGSPIDCLDGLIGQLRGSEDKAAADLAPYFGSDVHLSLASRLGVSVTGPQPVKQAVAADAVAKLRFGRYGCFSKIAGGKVIGMAVDAGGTKSYFITAVIANRQILDLQIQALSLPGLDNAATANPVCKTVKAPHPDSLYDALAKGV